MTKLINIDSIVVYNKNKQYRWQRIKHGVKI